LKGVRERENQKRGTDSEKTNRKAEERRRRNDTKRDKYGKSKAQK